MKFGLVTVITLMIGTFLPVSNLTSTVSAAAATPEIEAESGLYS